MAIVNTAVIGGPANIKYNDGTERVYYSEKDIVVNMIKEEFEIRTGAHGVTRRRLSQRFIDVTFTPAGEWEDGEFQALLPGSDTTVGELWFGDPGAPYTLEVLPIVTGQNKFTLHNCAIFSLPGLRFSAVQTLLGAVTFRGILVSETEWSAAASLFTVAAGTPDDTDYNVAKVKTQGYSATWGAIAGFVAFDNADGIMVDHAISLSPVPTDSWGIVNYRFQDLVASIKCKPIGPTEAQIAEAMYMTSASAARGGDISATAAFSITPIIGGSPYVTYNNAQLQAGSAIYDPETQRSGELTWVTTRTPGSTIFDLATPA